VNEAAIRAAGQGKKMVTSEELDFALNKIIGGKFRPFFDPFAQNRQKKTNLFECK
jgi:ATP-dependent Zn protease